MEKDVKLETEKLKLEEIFREGKDKVTGIIADGIAYHGTIENVEEVSDTSWVHLKDCDPYSLTEMRCVWQGYEFKRNVRVKLDNIESYYIEPKYEDPGF